MTKTNEQTIKDLQTDLDFLIKKYGKLEVATRSLSKRVEELEAGEQETFTYGELVYLRRLLVKRDIDVKSEIASINDAVNREKITTEEFDEAIVDIKEEQDILEELSAKVCGKLDK